MHSTHGGDAHWMHPELRSGECYFGDMDRHAFRALPFPTKRAGIGAGAIGAFPVFVSLQEFEMLAGDPIRCIALCRTLWDARIPAMPPTTV